MATVETILVALQDADTWEDGESCEAIRARLTTEQLAAHGSLRLRITDCPILPGAIRGRVEQNGVLLFEVCKRLPKEVSREDIQRLVREWEAMGYFEQITIRSREIGA